MGKRGAQEQQAKVINKRLKMILQDTGRGQPVGKQRKTPGLTDAKYLCHECFLSPFLHNPKKYFFLNYVYMQVSQ